MFRRRYISSAGGKSVDGGTSAYSVTLNSKPLTTTAHYYCGGYFRPIPEHRAIPLYTAWSPGVTSGCLGYWFDYRGRLETKLLSINFIRMLVAESVIFRIEI